MITGTLSTSGTLMGVEEVGMFAISNFLYEREWDQFDFDLEKMDALGS